jgi:molybdate transport system substrate-binding protein
MLSVVPQIRKYSAARTFPVVALTGMVALLGGCAPAAADSTADTGGSTAPEGTITVFAAASLKGAFTELASDFEAANPGSSVALNFAGSSDLVTQIVEGAPADVFASADEEKMAELTDAGLVDAGATVDFATNVLTIVVPAGNPAGVADFADLADPDLKTVLCAEQVPCGSAAVAAQKAAGVALHPVSEESSVTDVLGKVSSGEADAGLVYVTDVLAAGDAVEGIDFPQAADAVNTYPIAPVADSSAPALAQAFVDFVAGSAGRAVLGAAGFGQP